MLQPRLLRPVLGSRHVRVHRAAVDVLADDVAVAGMTGDLLDEVKQHPTNFPRVEILLEERRIFRDRYLLTEIGNAGDHRLGVTATFDALRRSRA